MTEDRLTMAARAAAGGTTMTVPLEEIVKRGTRRQRSQRVRATGVIVVVCLALAAPMMILRASPALAGGFTFADGRVVDVHKSLRDDGQLEELRAVLGEHGIGLDVEERPVQPQADRRVFEITYPSGAQLDAQGRMVVDDDVAGTVVTLEIGRADTDASASAGLTIFESIPLLCEVVESDDPAATGAALREHGFNITWVLVDFRPYPGAENSQATEVSTPPAGTQILSVLDRDGAAHDVPGEERDLLIELQVGAEGGHEPLQPCG